MRGRVLFAVFLLIVAPVASAVIIAVLLLFHVPPPVVFAPGRAVKSLFEAAGAHPPNAVAVLSTAFTYWLIIAIAGFAWERRKIDS